MTKFSDSIRNASLVEVRIVQGQNKGKTLRVCQASGSWPFKLNAGASFEEESQAGAKLSRRDSLGEGLSGREIALEQGIDHP